MYGIRHCQSVSFTSAPTGQVSEKLIQLTLIHQPSLVHEKLQYQHVFLPKMQQQNNFLIHFFLQFQRNQTGCNGYPVQEKFINQVPVL